MAERRTKLTLDVELNLENLSYIYELIHPSSIKEKMEVILEFIDNNAQELFSSEEYLDYQLSLIEEIVKRDTFELPEMEIFEMLLAFKSANDYSMDDAFKSVRLNLIAPEDYAKTVRDTKVFSDDDYFKAFSEEKKPRHRKNSATIVSVPADLKSNSEEVTEKDDEAEDGEIKELQVSSTEMHVPELAPIKLKLNKINVTPLDVSKPEVPKPITPVPVSPAATLTNLSAPNYNSIYQQIRIAPTVNPYVPQQYGTTTTPNYYPNMSADLKLPPSYNVVNQQKNQPGSNVVTPSPYSSRTPRQPNYNYYY